MTFISAVRMMGKKPGSGGGSLSYAYLGYDDARPNSTTHTWSSVNLGAADANRWIVGMIGHSYSGDTPTVTIGGVTATIDVVQNSNAEGVFIVRAHVPSGTTGDVVMSTATDVFNNCAYGLWRVIGEPELLASDAQQDNPATTVSAATSSAGFVIAAAGEQNGQHSISWTNVTERFDEDEGSNAGRRSGADADGTGSTITATATAEGSGRLAVALASYQPA